MSRYSLPHLADSTLLRDLAAIVVRDRTNTADLLAHLAEVDARKLYLPAAYPSMFAYCVDELRLSEDAAAKRIQAARAARRFPAIFDAVAHGRLHLSAVVLLAPHLSEATADGLLAAATHKSKAQIEQLLGARFPRPGLLGWVTAMPASSSAQPAAQHAPGHVVKQAAPGQLEGRLAPEPATQRANQVAPGQHDVRRFPEPVTAPHVTRAANLSHVQPVGPKCYAVQFTMSQSAHDDLRHAQELLGHQIPTGELGQVFERALRALVEKLERQKLAATSRPSRNHRPSANPRHVPAHVKRAVWQRDGGQCTFTSESGRRCAARTRLEFDHIEPVARGGEATLSGIRLRCRAHNQFEAERTFGAEFMRQKRDESRRRTEASRHAMAAPAAADGPGMGRAPA